MTLYKVLGEKGECINGGRGEWFLPKGKRPGKWMPAVKGDVVPCINGYHLCRASNLLSWLGPTIYEAEYKGELVEGDDKVVVRQARLVRKCGNWNSTTARLFAADCAERVLPIFEKTCPGDDRPRKAIEAARAFARGEINNAARKASAVAAWTAARNAARAAAWTAVWDAGWDAARESPRNAAAAAEASDAAAASCAAWYAAMDAARAARRAAMGAEIEWQQNRLLQYLTGEVA